MKKLFDILHSARKWYWRTFNVKTFGVRVIVKKDDEFLLVKHRYGDFWVFPGGGVNKNEDVRDAGVREVLEETGIHIGEFERTLGEYNNTAEGKNDTVTVLIAREWKTLIQSKWSLEIKEKGFFDVGELPKNTSPATVRRINEYLSGGIREFSGKW